MARVERTRRPTWLPHSHAALVPTMYTGLRPRQGPRGQRGWELALSGRTRMRGPDWRRYTVRWPRQAWWGWCRRAAPS